MARAYPWGNLLDKSKRKVETKGDKYLHWDRREERRKKEGHEKQGKRETKSENTIKSTQERQKHLGYFSEQQNKILIDTEKTNAERKERLNKINKKNVNIRQTEG